jgi:hypothetical protein
VKIHVRPVSLHALASSLSEEHREMMAHLAQCARCRSQLGAILDSRPKARAEKLAEVVPWRGREEADYSRALAAAERRFLARAESLAVERAEAPARLAELMEQPPERREILIRNYPRFRTWGLLERLLDCSQQECLVDTFAAEGTARLSLTLAETLDAGYYGAERIEDLRARAWGLVANARRIRFELQSAEKGLEAAFFHLRRGTRDILERAFLLNVQASLLRARRRFAEAERSLLRVQRIYREVGETHRLGQALISCTVLYEQAGTPEKSIPLLHEALNLIDGERDPRLLLSGHHNLITILAESGRFMEARGLMIQARPLYARFPESQVQNRRQWVVGRIARGLGQVAEAEKQLREAREGFIAEGSAYDTALVSLELAALYSEQGRAAELKQIAAGMLAIFSSQQIHREALAALSFLHQAVLAERASLETVTGVAAFLKRLQHDPNLSFAQPPGDQ